MKAPHDKIPNISRRDFREGVKNQNDHLSPFNRDRNRMHQKTKIEASEVTTQIQLIYPSSYKIRIWGFVLWILGSLKNLPSMMPSLERHLVTQTRV